MQYDSIISWDISMDNHWICILWSNQTSNSRRKYLGLYFRSERRMIWWASLLQCWRSKCAGTDRHLRECSTKPLKVSLLLLTDFKSLLRDFGKLQEVTAAISWYLNSSRKAVSQQVNFLSKYPFSIICTITVCLHAKWVQWHKIHELTMYSDGQVQLRFYFYWLAHTWGQKALCFSG